MVCPEEAGDLSHKYPPKNGKARVAPLPAAACGELPAALRAQKEYKLAQGGKLKEAGHVLPKKDDTPMAPSSLKSQWWNWMARQKIDLHLPIHGLRDSFGTWVDEFIRVSSLVMLRVCEQEGCKARHSRKRPIAGGARWRSARRA